MKKKNINTQETNFGHPSDREMRKAFLEWLSEYEWINPFAVTLTFKQSISGYIGPYETRFHLDHYKASQEIQHFYNIINRQVYGNAGKRYGKETNMVSIMEKTITKKLHYHLAIDCPKDELVAGFPEILKQAWLKNTWGNAQIDVQPNMDFGWINYIAKLRDKSSYPDSIDWVNSHIMI